MVLLTATLSIDQLNYSPGFFNFQLTKNDPLTLKMASPRVVKMSVANNIPVLRTPVTQMIIFKQGIFFSGYHTQGPQSMFSFFFLEARVLHHMETSCMIEELSGAIPMHKGLYLQ